MGAWIWICPVVCYTCVPVRRIEDSIVARVSSSMFHYNIINPSKLFLFLGDKHIVQSTLIQISNMISDSPKKLYKINIMTEDINSNGVQAPNDVETNDNVNIDNQDEGADSIFTNTYSIHSVEQRSQRARCIVILSKDVHLVDPCVLLSSWPMITRLLYSRAPGVHIE